MSRLLASVRSESEAKQVLQCGADIIDCKDPADGALGALPPETILRIVHTVGGERPVSATVGNIPTDMRQLRERVARTSDCGVDYVKVGLFEPNHMIDQLRAFAALSDAHALIAVVFADIDYPAGLLERLADCGVRGVMVDTADKQAGSLTELWSGRQIADFVRQARDLQLLSGVAGRVGLHDIPRLLACEPDYIGFRSALCGGDRRQTIDRTATKQIRLALPVPQRAAMPRAAGGARH